LLPISPPRISIARFEMTSFAFMLVWVPEPVCQTTRGKCSISVPSMTSSAASVMACAMRASSAPSLALASAAAFFWIPSARTSGTGMRSPPIRKF
jgi:hypothetical protein